jgi:hypothetical protein
VGSDCKGPSVARLQPMLWLYADPISRMQREYKALSIPVAARKEEEVDDHSSGAAAAYC